MKKQGNLIFFVPQKSTADKMNADADSRPSFISQLLLRFS